MPVIIPNIETLLIVIDPILILIFAMILISIYIFINGLRLSRYLKKHKPSQWKELSNPSTKKTFTDPFLQQKYIFNDKDTEDKNILEFKKKLRKAIKLSIIVGIMLFIGIIYAVTIAYSGYFTIT